VRRRAKSLELVSLSGADPLNLAGIVTPGETVPRRSGRNLHLDGVPIASQSGREVHMSEDRDRGAAWEARKALLRRGIGATRLSVVADGMTPPRKAWLQCDGTVACAPYAPYRLAWGPRAT